MERDVIGKDARRLHSCARTFSDRKADGTFPVIMQRTPYNKANYNANGAPFAIRAQPLAAT